MQKDQDQNIKRSIEGYSEELEYYKEQIQKSKDLEKILTETRSEKDLH